MRVMEIDTTLGTNSSLCHQPYSPLPRFEVPFNNSIRYDIDHEDENHSHPPHDTTRTPEALDHLESFSQIRSTPKRKHEPRRRRHYFGDVTPW